MDRHVEGEKKKEGGETIKMKINYKKNLKFVTLLIASLLIATVSATVYYSLTMESKITVGATWVKFVNATDTPTGSTVQNSFCSLSLSSLPNSTIIYEKAIGLNNTYNGIRYIRLRHVSVTPNGTAPVSNFTYVKFYLLDASNAVQATLNYTTSGDNWSVTSTTDWKSVPALTIWYIKVETLSPTGATATTQCTITIAADVQQ
jgi:hypothetical protein